MNSKLSQFQNKSRKYFQLFHVLLQSRSQPIFIGSKTLQKLYKNIFILQRCFFQLLLQARNETNWSTTGANDGKNHIKPTTPALQKHLFLLPIPLLKNCSSSPACPSECHYRCPRHVALYKKCSKDEASLTLYKQLVFTEQYLSFLQLLI